MNEHALATAFGKAFAGQDVDALSSLLTDDVRLRALLPAVTVEEEGRDAVLARFEEWMTDNVGELVEAVGEDVGFERVFIHYRLNFELVEGPHVMTQSAVCSVHDGLIFRISLVCSGYRRRDDDLG